MYETYIGCQPIYSKDLNLTAYQLLFRNSEANTASFNNADNATSEVILNTLTDIGLDKLVGNHKAHINFTRNFILGKYPIPNIKRRIVIDLMADMEYDTALYTALDSLSLKGFTIAMSDEVYKKYFKGKHDIDCIVKVDIQKHKKPALEKYVNSLRDDSLRLLAEKIETQDEFAYCNEIGFDYYQGFFFCQPRIIKSKSIPANKLQLIKVLSKLQDPKTDVNELEEYISAEVSLSFRLLRYANSSNLGMNTRVESIRNAISLLGWNTVRMLTTLLTIASVEDKPPELFRFALIRAKMCEFISEPTIEIDKHAAFTAGLLSIVDALLDANMEDILSQLPLTAELTNALMNHDGKLGHILHDVICYIHNKPEEATQLGLPLDHLKDYYIRALMWANAMAPMFKD